MNNLGLNIRKIREKRGYSQEFMATQLGIAQASYARIENENTSLTVQRLTEIAKLLETDITELFNFSKQVIQTQNNHEGSYGNHGYVENLHIENKEAYQNHIHTLEQEVTHLKEEIVFLRKLAEK